MVGSAEREDNSKPTLILLLLTVVALSSSSMEFSFHFWLLLGFQPILTGTDPHGHKGSGGGGDDGASKGTRRRSSSSNAWLATNPSKRWGEAFLLLYTPLWLTLCLGIVVPYKLYETTLINLKIGIDPEELYRARIFDTGIGFNGPLFLVPLIIVAKADSGKHLKDRYWVKANLWLIIFSYVRNYFWTHYFFTVLGASYTFPSWKMNNVPHTTFLLAHACFILYHMAANMTLWRLRNAIAGLPKSIQFVTEAAWILAFSYFIAYLETLAISKFPYYDFVDRDIMYKVGSLFYAIYFIVSFPMFSRVDEKDSSTWSLGRVAVDALGAAMLVTIIIILYLWRLFLGPIVPISGSSECNQPGLTWFSAHGSS